MHNAGRRLTARADSGFTLIELIVAMVILATMSLAVIGIILHTQSQGVTNRNRIAASNLAAREIDLVRMQFGATDAGPLAVANAGLVENGNPLAGGVLGQPLVVDGTAYTVTRTAQWNVTGTGASACEGGSLVAYPTLGVTVSVTWPNMGSVKPVVTRAVLAPDKDTGIPSTSSFIATKVVDQDAQPLSGIVMSATGVGTVTGSTDASGCAVLTVNPVVAGTAFTVRVVDPSYVDLSGATNPSKTTGLLTQGSIYSGASFSVGKAGSISVRLVRADGQPLSDSQVAGAAVSLVASSFSGSTGITTRTVTGVRTSFSGMYPTTYGAYFGATAPAGGYTVETLAPGGSISLDVLFEMADVVVENLPIGTTSVLAVPAGTATTCASGSGVSTGVGGSSVALSLLPGTYDLYASGNGFSCSSGPTAIPLGAGGNDGEVWGTTTLRLRDVPSGGTVWALNKALSGLTSLTTCPAAAGAAAVEIDGARNGAVALPAGTWFVYQTDGAATGACTSYPDVINPLPVQYGGSNERVWTATPRTATLTLTGLASSRYIVVSTEAATCTATAVVSTGKVVSAGPTTRSNASLSVSVSRPFSGQITYHAYVWDKSSKATDRCTSAGTFDVGANTQALSKAGSSTGVVGP